MIVVCLPRNCTESELFAQDAKFVRGCIQAVLFPTLVATCNANAANTQILSKAVNPKSLAGFIRTHKYGVKGNAATGMTSIFDTTCAALMSEAEWRDAEHFFDNFPDDVS